MNLDIRPKNTASVHGHLGNRSRRCSTSCIHAAAIHNPGNHRASFSTAAASHRGSSAANTSHINDKAAPLAALFTAAAGMLSHTSLDAALTDAQSKNTAPSDGKLPHSSAPIIAIAAKAGLGVAAGQSLQFSNGETLAVMSGQDSQFTSGGQLRMHSGQAIGLLAGAVSPGDNTTGLQLIAAQGPIDLQAQGGTLKVQAKDDLKVISANSHLDFAAAKSITLAVAGGASLTISGGNITFACPGKLLMQSSKVEMGAGMGMEYPLPALPQSVCVECLKRAQVSGSPFATR